MIQLLGISKNVSQEIREKFNIRSKKLKEEMLKLREFLNEVVIISTCNRTEIYFNCDNTEKEIIDILFNSLNWERELKKYIFHIKDEKVTKHIMELASGFHSKIVGEDQILGQIRDAYEMALEIKSINGPLQRLFQQAITCGKEFKNETKLYEIPVSYSSIAVNKAMDQGVKRFMVIGYGDMGSLAVKYILSHNIEKLYIVVRDKNSVLDIEDSRVEVINFQEKNYKLTEVECVISCTSAPHTVLKEHELDRDKEYLLFDLAIPRDIDESIGLRGNSELYDIDKIGLIDEENKQLRKERMESKRYVIEKHIGEFSEWYSLRQITPYIKKLKEAGNQVASDRITTYNNKFSTKNHKELASKLIKSTSDFYVNRAIEVLKEEKLKGCEEECLRIIEKIFMNVQN
ncbi:glutamyl-tRNA reductase [Clostridium sp. 'White wine YQ']|uniref:glutamyl-tRNA reductase n=1 Tax=Clostridium sp. 'White wine YQ' TaxID=3027474 RepID=UPI002366EDF9|nr:glutamyl-tRNA reductase [Clostridium sp. 'White wine YQ']MDD7795858.1 glutamyl-tRNA reductase [Clostridium sp. 'White wine YQ']